MEFLRYVFEAIVGALEKSVSKLGVGLTVVTTLFLFLVYALYNWSNIELVSSAIIAIDVFVFYFFIFLAWELQKHFPRIVVVKRNTMHGAELVITNKEVVDLTDLEVELYKRVWIPKEGAKLVFSIPPESRSFKVEGDPKIPYDGGIKVVLIGSGQNGTATFHLKDTELDTGFETTDGKTDIAVYEMTIRIKGKIKGRAIFPRKIAGILNYQRRLQDYSWYEGSELRSGRQVYSHMAWEDPNYKGTNWQSHTQI
jgi:hypothetical protein